ncbi:MAG TPA: lytic transglycosylase domain-containing protein [Pseudolabrys sp.]|nr:lytic transglycosylase domain-containing protein [Pseudolabrys sp.]
MVRMLSVGAILLIAASTASATEKFINQPNTNGDLEFLINKHASANNVPVSLVRRVIKRESRGNPRVISKGNYGLMQIRLGTARAMGYRGSAAGLLDADTNMTYAVKYLAGAYKAAGGNADRAVHYYAAGYYYAAKRKGLLKAGDPNALNTFASAAAGNGFASAPESSAVEARPALAAINMGRHPEVSGYTW